MLYTPADVALAQGVLLSVYVAKGFEPNQADLVELQTLTSNAEALRGAIDANGRNATMARINQLKSATTPPAGGVNMVQMAVPFQFPPRMPDDSRRANWDEQDAFATEPIATYRGSGAREMTLQFTYIVDGSVWTTARIGAIVKMLRGYFVLVRDRTLSWRNLVVMFQMWNIGGRQPASCRIKSASVKHSETMVIPNNDVSSAYPLRTDITIDLRMWSQGLEYGKDAKDPVSVVPNQDPFSPPDWY
jgi:hypothetical protein